MLAFEYPWVRIESKGEVLCFTVYNVRLVKLVKRLTPQQSSDLLLRPSGKAADE